MGTDSPDLSLAELEARMRPGVLSQEGFLGENERLSFVLAEDLQTLIELGVNYNELAEKLGTLIEKGRPTAGHTAHIDHFEVRITSYVGFQICPWSADIHRSQCTAGGGVQFGSLDWCIRNTRSGQELCGPGLIVHLIREHHFFEGFESPYRVDPRELTRLLELGPYS